MKQWQEGYVLQRTINQSSSVNYNLFMIKDLFSLVSFAKLQCFFLWFDFGDEIRALYSFFSRKDGSNKDAIDFCRLASISELRFERHDRNPTNEGKWKTFVWNFLSKPAFSQVRYFFFFKKYEVTTCHCFHIGIVELAQIVRKLMKFAVQREKRFKNNRLTKLLLWLSMKSFSGDLGLKLTGWRKTYWICFWPSLSWTRRASVNEIVWASKLSSQVPSWIFFVKFDQDDIEAKIWSSVAVAVIIFHLLIAWILNMLETRFFDEQEWFCFVKDHK